MMSAIFLGFFRNRSGFSHYRTSGRLNLIIGFSDPPPPRVDHISKSVSNVDSKLFIPFQYIRIYTKKNVSHIGTDLGVPQGGSNFTKGLIRANMSKTRK